MRPASLPVARAIVLDPQGIDALPDIPLGTRIMDVRSITELSQNPDPGLDACVFHYRDGVEPIPALIQELRASHQDVGILVFTRGSSWDGLDPDEKQRLSEEFREMGSDFFEVNFRLDTESVKRAVGLLKSIKRSRLEARWDSRFEFLETGGARDWASAAHRLSQWLVEDGFSRVRFFRHMERDRRFVCLARHGAGDEGPTEFGFDEVEPILESEHFGRVSFWNRDRLRRAYKQTQRTIPTAIREFYLTGPAFPWVYVSIRHGGRVLANIGLDRRGTAETAVTKLDEEYLNVVSRRMSDFLGNLEDAESKRRIRSTRSILPTRPVDLSADLGLIAEDEGFKRVLATAEMIASSDLPVLIVGETGVGKEVLTRFLHTKSSQRGLPFLPVNCAAMVSSLTNELFGSVKGAYTDAPDRPGFFEAARGGTLFLDEIGDLDPDIQARLLRVLNTGEVTRVGSSDPQDVEFRLVCATNRNLDELMESGKFRHDLFFRVAAQCLEIPALRNRPADIGAILDNLLIRFERTFERKVRLDPEVESFCYSYSWPGNVRQFINVIDGALRILGDSNTLTMAHLPRVILVGASQSKDVGPGRAQAMYEKLVEGDGCFWTLVRPEFRARHLTKFDVQRIVEMGLTETRGSYTQLAKLFNLDPSEDYSKFMAYLRSHDCHLDYRPFRRGTDRG